MFVMIASSQMIYNMDDFLRLDDTVLRQIQFSKNPDMAKAQGILRRLNERNLYQYLVEYTVPDTHLREYKKVTARVALWNIPLAPFACVNSLGESFQYDGPRQTWTPQHVKRTST